jgi:hypothetical protein
MKTTSQPVSIADGIRRPRAMIQAPLPTTSTSSVRRRRSMARWAWLRVPGRHRTVQMGMGKVIGYDRMAISAVRFCECSSLTFAGLTI